MSKLPGGGVPSDPRSPPNLEHLRIIIHAYAMPIYIYVNMCNLCM